MPSVLIDENDDELRCPKCGDDNLHQGTVEVFNRRKEDEPSLAVLIPPNGVPISGDPNRNPSDRRQGLIVCFWCETCGDSDPEHEILKLQIYQHKGTTYIRWEE